MDYKVFCPFIFYPPLTRKKQQKRKRNPKRKTPNRVKTRKEKSQI
jgi:hypothetical protein